MSETPASAGSIVIPAYDEEGRIERTVAEALGWLAAHEGLGQGEVIVVDDGSRDRTAELAEAAGARVIRLGRNLGKGAAVRAGVLAARGDPVLFADADLSAPIAAWEPLREAHAAGADVAVGQRTRETISRRQPVYRIALGKAGRFLAELLLRHGVRDTQCGFKSFRAQAARRIFERTTVDRYGFDMEVLVIARELGLRVVPVPVPWAHEPLSRVRPVRDGLRTLGELGRIFWNRLRGRYGA